MQKQEPSSLATLLRSQITQQSLINFLEYSDRKAQTVFPAKKELQSLGQSLKTRTIEIIESTLRKLVCRYSKVFLLYSHQQLMLLLSVLLSCNPTKEMVEVALKYMQQMIETAHLLAFRNVKDTFHLELYSLFAYFSGMLNILAGATIQNGLFPKVLKILSNLNRHVNSFLGIKVLAELLVVVCFASKLNEESKRLFVEAMKKMTKGKSKENLYSLALSSNQRILEFNKIAIFRLSDDILQKADININVRKREIVLLPSNKKCWPAWVDQAYRSNTPQPPPVEPIFQSIKPTQVYESLQNLQLWASSPKINDPSALVKDEAIDLLVRYLQNKMYPECKYAFHMSLWKSKCKSIQQMSVSMKDKQKDVIREDILSLF